MIVLLYVEGDTEEAALPGFFHRWLIGKGSDLEIKAINFKGVGGYLREFSKRAKRDLSGTYAQGIIGLIDLYGCRLPFPDGSLAEKYSWAEGRTGAKGRRSRIQPALRSSRDRGVVAQWRKPISAANRRPASEDAAGRD